jgi:ATP-dependent protease HslVU (ClpYQ) peptidase subunit
MTTIAYKDGVLAADTCRVVNGIATKCSKLHRLEDGSVFAGAGNSTDIAKCFRWLTGGEKPANELESLSALHLTEDGLFYIDGALEPLLMDQEYWAVGSGADFAIAGMFMGMSAQDAVTLASKLDIHTQLPLEVIIL